MRLLACCQLGRPHVRIRRFAGRDENQLPVLKTFLSNVLEAVATGKQYREEHGLFE